MGADIHGWIEIKQYGGWDAIVRINNLVERQYRIFGSFFGVRNYGDFPVLFGKRGLPVDISRVVREEFERLDTDAHSPSWVSWQEISEIDWNESGIDFWWQGCIQGYQEIRLVRETAQLFRDRAGIKSSDIDDENDWIDVAENHPLLDELNIKITRQYMIDQEPGWKMMLAMMKQLAEVYGSDGVRLVVWFDN